MTTCPVCDVQEPEMIGTDISTRTVGSERGAPKLTSCLPCHAVAEREYVDAQAGYIVGPEAQNTRSQAVRSALGMLS